MFQTQPPNQMQSNHVDDFVNDIKRYERKEEFIRAMKSYEQKYYDACEQQLLQNMPIELQKCKQQPNTQNVNEPMFLNMNRFIDQPAINPQKPANQQNLYQQGNLDDQVKLPCSICNQQWQAFKMGQQQYYQNFNQQSEIDQIPYYRGNSFQQKPPSDPHRPRSESGNRMYYDQQYMNMEEPNYNRQQQQKFPQPLYVAQNPLQNQPQLQKVSSKGNLLPQQPYEQFRNQPQFTPGVDVFKQDSLKMDIYKQQQDLSLPKQELLMKQDLFKQQSQPLYQTKQPQLPPQPYSQYSYQQYSNQNQQQMDGFLNDLKNQRLAKQQGFSNK